jgi:two-component system, cell cycle response regulator
MARILVIEDNPDSLKLIAYLLKAFGHTTLTAPDGEAGLAAAEREVPDLIICDIQLPGLDGHEVARRLKSHPTLRGVPLVAVTAYAMRGDRDRMLASGFDGYIPKPIDPRKFVGEVQTFLKMDPRVASGLSAQMPETPSAPPPRKRGTILVVDDSSVNIRLVRSTLEPSGYQVFGAKNAGEALVLARKAPPDLILSDVHMRDGDGFALIKAVKAEPRLESIPFAFLTSTLWREKDWADGLALGAIRVIFRPIEPQALLSEIEACLGR